MLRYFNKFAVEHVIPRDGVEALVRLLATLDRTYPSIMQEALRLITWEDEARELRESQVREATGSYGETQTLDIFRLSEEELAYGVLEIGHLSSLQTPFGKAHQHLPGWYLKCLVFCETAEAQRRLAGFTAKLLSSTQKCFALRRRPPTTTISLVNRHVERLRNAHGQTKAATSDQLSLVTALQDNEFRKLVLKAKQAKDPTVANIAASIPASEETVAQRLALPDARHVFRREYCAICANSKCGRGIARAPTKGAIRRMAQDGIACSTCGTPLDPTHVEDVYVLKPSAATLIEGSKWLSLHVAACLESVGIRRNRILTEIIDDSHELDVVADHEGKFLLAELKDDRFSMGHAYKFAGKCSRYKPDIPVIIATGGIDEDARTYLKNSEIEAHYIESVAALEATLRDILGAHNNRLFLSRLQAMQWDAIMARAFMVSAGMKDAHITHRWSRAF
ncbi:MAG: hypothetical protein H6806_04755 [Planctomycetes bacterium]|nr:hypothetical protein [Planctomycetota bacterium]